jgi:hypothetical protein
MRQASLFDISKISKETVKSQNVIRSVSHRKTSKLSGKLGKATQAVQDVIGPVSMGESIHFVSMGEWSSHNLLLYLLDQTGPANVYISTWSVSENAVRQLIDAIYNKQIQKLYCVFDWRVKLRRPEVFSLVQYNISDIRLTTCHAKVTVIQNDTWHIAIVGSANYTNNPRIEAGVIACDKEIAEFHKYWMLAELKNADPFETAKRRKS